MLQSEFLNWDDDLYVTQNHWLQSEDGFYWIWIENQMPNPYPITFSVLRLEILLFGLSSVGFHLVNLTFHLINILLLGSILRLFKVSFFVQFGTLLIYALHPVQVETVMWVSELKNLLSASFYWISLFAFFKYFEAKTHKTLYYSLGLASFVFSLAAKSMTVTLPVTLLLWVALFYRHRFKQLFVALVPLFFISVFFGVLSMKNEALFYQNRDLIFTFHSFSERIHNLVESFLFYVWKFFYPYPLSAVYPPHPLLEPESKMAYLAIVLSFLFLISVVFFRKFWSQQKLLFFALLNYGIVAGPVSGFFPTTYTWLTVVADRYNYHSIPFLAFAFCLFLQHFFSLFEKKKFSQSFVVFLALVLSILSSQHAWNWISSVSLWLQASRVNAKSSFVYEYLGMTYWEKGQLDLAEQAYKKAVEVQPDYYLAHNNYANFLVRKGDFKKALVHYLIVVEKAPDLGVAHHNLGNIYYYWGQEAEAISCYERARQAKHPSYLGLVNLGALYWKNQQPEKALACFEQALRENIETGRAHQKIAQIYGRKPEAEKHLLAFLKEFPTEVSEWIALAEGYVSQKNDLKARETYQQALSYNATSFLLWKKYVVFSIRLTQKEFRVFQEIEQELQQKSTVLKPPILPFFEAILFGARLDYPKALLRIKSAVATEAFFDWKAEKIVCTPTLYRNYLRMGNTDLLQELEKEAD